MLTPEYLLRISEGSEEIAERLHSDILNAIVSRIVIRMNRGEDYILTAVETGFTDGVNVQIVSGLQEGDVYYIASVAEREEKNDETR